MKIEIPQLKPLEEERHEAAVSCGDLYFENLVRTMAGFAAQSSHDPESEFVYGMARRIMEAGLRDHPVYKKRLQELLAARARELEFQKSSAAKEERKTALRAKKIEEAENRIATSRESAMLAREILAGAKESDKKDAEKDFAEAQASLQAAEEDLAKLKAEESAAE